MPLVFAPLNKDLKIIKIVTDNKTKKHLENLGITLNSEIKVLSSSGGNVISIVKSGRLALDKNLAVKIFVA